MQKLEILNEREREIYEQGFEEGYNVWADLQPEDTLLINPQPSPAMHRALSFLRDLMK